MQFFNKPTHIDFMGKRRLALILSTTLIVLSLTAITMRGFNFGIDFTGGTLIEVGYPQPADLNGIRAALAARDYGDAMVQHFGTASEVLIRLAPREGVSSATLSDNVIAALRGENSAVEMRRQEFVGPQVGEELIDDGGLAVLYSLFGILVYVMLRFEWRFAVGSVAALAHDVVIVLGLFALLQLEFDLTVLAALLAVIGYSLNDTIVVFDRIRENFRLMRKGSAREIIDQSLNQTLSRTLLTSLTTLLVLAALFLFGGELIHGFASALIAGVVVGTYSSIYVASTTTLGLGISKEDLMPVESEGAELDDLP